MQIYIFLWIFLYQISIYFFDTAIFSKGHLVYSINVFYVGPVVGNRLSTGLSPSPKIYAI